MNKDDLKILYAEYERQALEEARENAQARKYAVGILKNQAIVRARSKGQGIVLAYGLAAQVKYSLEDLNAFVKAIDKHQAKSDQSVQGVPYAALLRASRKIDKERSKKVRNATLYQRKGNIIFFQVTGNSRPFYRVQIRLEDWDNAVVDSREPSLVSIRKVLAGRISFECPCGRHQFWYRYMASIGNYGLKPIETGFPKIRNRKLEGCCCKHILKVLHELKSNRIIFILTKELDKERASKTYSGISGKKVLSVADLRLARAKRMNAAAMVAFRKYEAEAAELKNKVKPRNVSKKFMADLRNVFRISKAKGKSPESGLTWIADMYDIPVEEVRAIARELGLYS